MTPEMLAAQFGLFFSIAHCYQILSPNPVNMNQCIKTQKGGLGPLYDSGNSVIHDGKQ